MAKTLENGSFQDPAGTEVREGTIEFVLSQDAMIIAGGQVAPTRVSATLTTSGDMPANFTILANDELTPGGTFYLVTVFNSGGARVFGPERWVLSGASPINLDTLTPTIVDPAFADPILSNPASSQTITGFQLVADITTAASVTSNVLRALNQDNSTNSHTGDTNETTLSTFTLPANTMGSAGAIHILASGTTTLTNGTKDLKLYFGTALTPTLQVPQANTDDWHIEAWIFNTTTTTQRYITQAHRATAGAGAITSTGNLLGTRTEDTTTNLTLKVTGTLSNGSDTVSQLVFDIFLVQF